MGRQHSPTDDLRELRAVLLSETLSAPQRLVTMALVLHRHGGTGRCDPSVARLVQETGLSERCVQTTISELERSGFLLCERRPGRRTCYDVASPTPAGGAPPQEVHPRSTFGGAPQEVHPTPAGGAPERTKERTKERTDVVAALWSTFREEMQGSRLTLTSTRSKKLLALHDEQLSSEPDPVQAFRRILRAVKASDFHMGKREYQTPESLFRSEERRETWAEKGRTNGKPTDPLLMSTTEIPR